MGVDEGLLIAACEATTEEAFPEASVNDLVLLMKAVSKYKCKDMPTVDTLLRRIHRDVVRLTAADASQLLVAILRMNVADRLAQDGPHAGLLCEIFKRAQRDLGDIYLPPRDLTNLCVAASLFHPMEESRLFLTAVLQRLKRSAVLVPPLDVIRRLLSVAAFDVESNRQSQCRVVDRLGPQGLGDVCHAAASCLSQRINEVDPEMCVAACEAVSRLVPFFCEHTPIGSSRSSVCVFWDHQNFHPVLALLLQRLPGLSDTLVCRAAHAVVAMSSVFCDPLVVEILSVMHLEVRRRPFFQQHEHHGVESSVFEAIPRSPQITTGGNRRT